MFPSFFQDEDQKKIEIFSSPFSSSILFFCESFTLAICGLSFSSSISLCLPPFLFLLFSLRDSNPNEDTVPFPLSCDHWPVADFVLSLVLFLN